MRGNAVELEGGEVVAILAPSLTPEQTCEQEDRAADQKDIPVECINRLLF